MKTLIPSLLLAAGLSAAASGASAACYAEYKARRDAPYGLHYGIMLLSDGGCPGRGEAEQAVRARLQAGGWALLDLTGLSQSEPSAQKRENAGAFYLRF